MLRIAFSEPFTSRITILTACYSYHCIYKKQAKNIENVMLVGMATLSQITHTLNMHVSVFFVN